MWDKLTRKVIFLYLYNSLFWDNNSAKPLKLIANPKDLQDLVQENSNISKKDSETSHWNSDFKLSTQIKLDKLYEINDLDPDFKKVSKESVIETIELFEKHKLEFESQLLLLLTNWNQTYTIVKAILLTCLTEIKSVETTNEKETTQTVNSQSPHLDSIYNQLVGKYLRLAQDYANSQSVSVIHAVLAKVLKQD